LLARARAGAEAIIEDDQSPAILLRTVHVRPLSESLRLAKDHGSTETLDSGFADDLKMVVNGHSKHLQTS